MDCGDFKHLSTVLVSVFDSASIACDIRPNCESPIEIDLGVQLTKALRLMPDNDLTLKAQYVFGPYRYDFAIVREGRRKPIALIECDGAEFHSTSEQLANDRAKDALARAEDIFPFRFSGSEIYRDANACVAKIIETLRSQAYLSNEEWRAFEVSQQK